jgi:SAM-dependent methyltransferase
MKTEMVGRLLRATTELGLTFRCQDGTWSRTTKGDLLIRSHPTSLAYSALEMAGPYIRKWLELDATLMGLSSASDIFAEASTLSDRAMHLQLMMNSYAVHDYTRAVSALLLPSNGSVVDAGGGLGAMARQMKASNPQLDVVVLERPEICKLANSLSKDSGVRWTPGDFTRSWPILADVVTMSRVLHDWDDHKFVEILRHAKASLRPGGRIIAIETVLSEQGWEGGLCDLHLLVLSGGKERTLSEFITLFESAGLILTDVLEASSLHKALHFKPTP